MSIFDKLKNTAQNIAKSAVQIGKDETFTFTALPESVEQLKALPEAALDTPYKAAALTVCALCAYAADAEVGKQMFEFLRGPGGPLSQLDQQFLKDRFANNKFYVPFSYFAGATPENNYEPTQPYTIKVCSNSYSFQNEGYATLWITSGGADNPRQVDLRQVGSTGKWYVRNHEGLTSDIRKPKSADPWA